MKKNGTKRKKNYSKYVRCFGMGIVELRSMTRPEFCKRFGSKFKYMGQAKFIKKIKQIATAYERGKETLKDYA